MQLKCISNSPQNRRILSLQRSEFSWAVRWDDWCYFIKPPGPESGFDGQADFGCYRGWRVITSSSLRAWKCCRVCPGTLWNHASLALLCRTYLQILRSRWERQAFLFHIYWWGTLRDFNIKKVTTYCALLLVCCLIWNLTQVQRTEAWISTWDENLFERRKYSRNRDTTLIYRESKKVPRLSKTT